MDRVIYTAMGGVQQALSAQAIVGNNLANVSTNGFKAQLAAARTVEVTDPHGQATRMFPLSSTPGSDNRAGPINFTARSLDVALSDGGYLLVQLENGQQALTRNGNIQVSAEGQLTINGRPVMGGGAEIQIPPNAQLSIASDGTITGFLPTEPPTKLTQIGKLRLVTANSEDLVRSDQGLFTLSPAALARGAQIEDSNKIKLVSGALEGSNVNAAEAMVAMISNARAFEMQMKVINSANENAQRSHQLLSIN